jgi:hypothetical protein
MRSCHDDVARFLNRGLREWTGLTPGCPTDEALDGFKADAAGHTVRLGRRDLEYATYPLVTVSTKEPVTAYVRNDEVVLLRTEHWSFDAFECAALLETLGDAAERADLIWRGRTVPGGEWLYPERGLSLGVLPESMVIVTASGYRATTAESYLQRFARLRPERDVAAPAG